MRNAYLLGKRDRGNTLFGGCKEVDSDKPLLHGYLALAKERTRLDSEIALALVATITLAVSKAEYLGVLTVRAEIPLSKADSLKVFAASLLAIEMPCELEQCLKLFHTPIVYPIVRVVKC